MQPRIAHVISTVEGVGGAERLLSAIVAGRDGREWDQLVLNPFVDLVSPEFTQLREEGRYKGRPCRRPGELPGVRRWLRAELAIFRPDIVHVVLFHALVVVATLPRRPGAKRLLTHAYGEGVRLAPMGWAKERVDRWAGKRFDRVVAISAAGRRLLVDDYGYPSAKVACIHPGWQGRPLPTSGAGPSGPTVVCVAKLRPEKGHDVLLDALAVVRDQVPDVRLVLVGDGELRPALARQASSLNLLDNVEFVGAVPEVWPYLADAHVFALASRSEAFGIAIVEAMAAGLPVVGAATGGIPELVTPGVTGELFPPSNHEALARHLVRLLTSPDLRARMGAAARQAAQAFTIEESVRRYYGVFAELLDRPEQTGPVALPALPTEEDLEG